MGLCGIDGDAETKCLRGWTCATSTRMRIRVSGCPSVSRQLRPVLHPADTAGAPHPLSIWDDLSLQTHLHLSCTSVQSAANPPGATLYLANWRHTPKAG
jgi:hypothetical protein